MTYKTRHGLRGMLAAGAMALAATIPLKAQAETTYNLALLSDFEPRSGFRLVERHQRSETWCEAEL